jgi:hypothetical protein
MPDNPELWTDAQRQAWDYVKSAHGEDLSQTAALNEYRAGGGAIRTTDWGEIWHRYDEGASQWDRLYQFKSNDVVPESLFNVVDINYSQRYTMTFRASVRDEEGNIIRDVYRQVESDTRQTIGEWQSAAAQALLEDPSVYATEVLTIEDIEFFEAAWALA